MIGYSKTESVKIVRTKYRITVGTSTTAKELREYLASVPDDATVDELVPDGDSGAEGEAVIVFHEERKASDE